MDTKKYEVVKDSKYGYLRANPIPSEEEVNQYYLEEFYAQNKDKFNNSSLETQLDQSDFFKALKTDTELNYYFNRITMYMPTIVESYHDVIQHNQKLVALIEKEIK